ncbi:MAG TPA: hypothetical protein DCX25_03470 [Candidatus Pacebacteria bacterium]|nr:MAG: D-alanine-D-alanine ligase [Microgenomates group bacterium GW2011_GWB1_45_17]KKU24253.1 MAG: D-alanine-D-alanine ligase [Microgenomates group bacterium GW2011_GWC1_46_15]KKU24969.1 MAG: D-alanine-D-alanine ligase [Microgenomates group bacterium GW2011_GWA1_46_15]HAV15363.1 hypothetical protein [Candidatus Paceibacterota bacterium]HCR93105.1 hypothetical protein [Candidatus Paceibacterota bacterium]
MKKHRYTSHHRSKLHIAVIYSVPTARMKHSSYAATDEDTASSARQIHRVLQEKGHTSTLHPITTRTINDIQYIHADYIFNVIEWTGVDLKYSQRAFTILEKLEKHGIPFTGASKQNYFMNVDKRVMKKIFDAEHIPTARWQSFKTGNELIRKDFVFPVIVKPCLEHCSIGLTRSSVVHTANELRAVIHRQILSFKQPVFAEEFVDGREFHVTVLEKNGVSVVLPIAEIQFDVRGTDAFLTYDSRWDEKHPEYAQSRVVPAKLPAKLDTALRDVSTRAFSALKFRDYTRVDIRVRNNSEIFVLEANTNPGLGADEDCALSTSFLAAGMTFADVVEYIVQSCMDRFLKQKKAKNTPTPKKKITRSRRGAHLVQYVI